MLNKVAIDIEALIKANCELASAVFDLLTENKITMSPKWFFIKDNQTAIDLNTVQRVYFRNDGTSQLCQQPFTTEDLTKEETTCLRLLMNANPK